MILRAPISTLFPYTMLFRSLGYASAYFHVDGHCWGRGAVVRNWTIHGTRKSQAFGIGVFGTCVQPAQDRKSTRLNSSHQIISYAVFCLKKKTQNKKRQQQYT